MSPAKGTGNINSADQVYRTSDGGRRDVKTEDLKEFLVFRG